VEAVKEPAGILEQELATYEANKPALLGTAEGRWVLIHDGEVAGTFWSRQDAITEGYRVFGNVPFLVRQVVAIEVPENFVSNHLCF
jgi:hypothetical protein